MKTYPVMSGHILLVVRIQHAQVSGNSNLKTFDTHTISLYIVCKNVVT